MTNTSFLRKLIILLVIYALAAPTFISSVSAAPPCSPPDYDYNCNGVTEPWEINCASTGDPVESFVCNFLPVTVGGLFAKFYNILFPVGLVVGIFAIVFAGYKIMTSQGNPEHVKEGSEDLTSAILGIIFIVLSIVILRVIIGSLLDDSISF